MTSRRRKSILFQVQCQFNIYLIAFYINFICCEIQQQHRHFKEKFRLYSQTTTNQYTCHMFNILLQWIYSKLLNAGKLSNLGSTQTNENFNRLVACKNPKALYYSGPESTSFRIAPAKLVKLVLVFLVWCKDLISFCNQLTVLYFKRSISSVKLTHIVNFESIDINFRNKRNYNLRIRYWIFLC